MKLQNFVRRFVSYVSIMTIALSMVTAGLPTALAASTISITTNGLQNNFPGAPIARGVTSAALSVSVTASQTSQTLTGITADFSGTGFETSDLEALAIDNTSGVQLYLDDGELAGNGMIGFNSGSDTLVTLDSPAWSSTSVTLTAATPVALTNGTAKVFWVVIKTSNTLTSGDEIRLTVPANGVVTSDGNGPTSEFVANNFTADTTAPTITSIKGAAGSSTLEVKFSEPVISIASLNIGNADHFTFTDNGTGGGSVISALSHNAWQDFMILTLDGNLDSGDFDGSPSTLAAA